MTRDFEAVRKIIDAAQAGSWGLSPVLGLSGIFGVIGGDSRIPVTTAAKKDDARFIAEARTGWPAALDEIERLREENERLFAENGMYYGGLLSKDAEIQRYRQALESIRSDAADFAFSPQRLLDKIEDIAREALADAENVRI